MIIEVSISGGFGGINLGPTKKQLNLKDIPEQTRSEICELFDPEKLEVMAREKGHSGAADMTGYKIVIKDGIDLRHEFKIREDAISPEMLDIIDEM